MINENIERLMYQSGRVEIDNFDLMVHNFYKDNKSFAIMPINYVIYDKDYVVYNPELRCFMNHHQFRSITEFKSCLTCNNLEYIPMIILDVESSDELVINGKIKPQYVKFVIPLDDNNIYVTDYLYEYRLFERRFVLYEIPYGINANLTYWLEVEPNQTFTKTLKRVK